MTPAFEHAATGKVELTPLPDGAEVVLPVCEHCGRITKQPWTPKGGTVNYCTGGRVKAHKRVKMVPYVFQSVGPHE